MKKSKNGKMRYLHIVSLNAGSIVATSADVTQGGDDAA